MLPDVASPESAEPTAAEPELNYRVSCQHDWAADPVPLLFPTRDRPTVTKAEAEAYAAVYRAQQDHACRVVVEPA
jgi:hypothetical protein